MTNDFKDLENRYLRDAEFNILVNTLIKIIEKCQFTPSEIKDAAMFAAIKFELTHPQARFFISPRREISSGD